MEFFKNLFQKQINLPVFSDSTIVKNARFGLSNQKGDDAYIKEYKNWVFACVNARAEELASIELELKKKGSDEIIESHELLDLLHDVNPTTTMYDLFFATQAFKDLAGNAYWYLARENEGKGKIRQIYMLSPEYMSLVVSKENPSMVAGYVYQKGNVKVPLEANEVLHFKNFNPKAQHPTPHKGVGVVEASLWAIETDNEARNWNYSFFRNSARPDGVLSTETTMTDEQFKRVKESWNQTHQGSANNGKTAILEGGLKWQDISKTQKDMDFVSQRTFSRDEILSLFRVPKTVVGITDDVNRANAEASDYVFARRTIKPLMKSFVTYLNEFLVPEFDKNIHFTFKDPVPEDRLATIQEFSLGVNKWLTRNDIRRREGLQESDNGNTFFGTIAEVPQDTVTVVKKLPKAETKSKPTVEQAIEQFIAKKNFSEVKEKTERKLTTAKKSVYKDLYVKRLDKNEELLAKEMKKYFDTQEKEVLANLESEFAGLKSVEYVLKGVDDVVFNEKQAVATGISLITPFIRRFIAEGAEMADSITEGNFNLNNTNTLNFIKERAKFFSNSINDTTKEALLTSLKEGIDNGESFNNLSDRVKAVYTEADEVRIERIVRTEVSTATNQGAIEAYKQAGIEKLEWVAITDDRTSDECLANDGETRKIGEEYPAGATEPPQHINCRCTTVAVFED